MKPDSRQQCRVWSAIEAEIDGYWLEFGVAKGDTLRIWTEFKQPVYGFDSFHGLSEPWHNLPAGTFDMGGIPPEIPGAIIVTGFFADTLPGWLAENPGPVAFLHIDCDLYASAEFVLRTLREAGRLIPGTVILFDEIVNYPGWREGEYRACKEQLEPYFMLELLHWHHTRQSFRLHAVV